MNLIDSTTERNIEQLVRRAGDCLLRYWPGSTSTSKPELEVQTKSDGSLLTRADIESNEILIRGLQELFPEDGIYSEEFGHNGFGSSQERVWIIDPLDGTKSFIDGADDFSILLSLCVHGSIEFGTMFFPARAKHAFAGRGRGAYLDGERLHVSSAAKFREKSIYLRHLPSSNQPWQCDRWMDAGRAFLRLCSGELDGIVVRLIHHQEWDLAASAILIEESGGRVTNEHGQPVQFKTAPVDYEYFVASNDILHDQLLSLIPRQSSMHP